MKYLVYILALVALVHADFEVDFNNVRRREIRLPNPFINKNWLPDERIVGGVEAAPNSVPYQVALFIQTSQGTFFCGGVLASDAVVLTAAHCAEGATQFQIVLGGHNITSTEQSQITVFSANFTLHPGWNSLTLVNDIAVIRLPQPVPLSGAIQPVLLPSLSQIGTTFAGQTGRISGWGLDSDAATSISQILRVVYTNIITNLVCNIAFLGIIQGSHVCTSGGDGVGACSGDSGGPLVVFNEAGNSTLVGLVSFGIALGCEVGWPSAFTRVTSFLIWLQTVTDLIIS